MVPTYPDLAASAIDATRGQPTGFGACAHVDADDNVQVTRLEKQSGRWSGPRGTNTMLMMMMIL